MVASVASSRNEDAHWVAHQPTPSFFDQDEPAKPETLAEFSIGEDRSVQVSFLLDPSSGLSIDFRPQTSQQDDRQAPLSLYGHTFVSYDPDRMSTSQADDLIRAALKSFNELSEKKSFMEPEGKEDENANLEGSINGSDSQGHEGSIYKPEYHRILDEAVQSIPQRVKLDKEASDQIKKQYELYRAGSAGIPKEDLSGYEGLIRAALHAQGIPSDPLWLGIRYLAAAIVAVEASTKRKDRLASRLALELFKQPIVPRRNDSETEGNDNQSQTALDVQSV